ncbi:MAG: bifunctional DNA primase/polymerase [Methanomassiliicoccus sp.]|nr:bifunctional DNA primase/polymerase [Methanomassiliicoccus sp.]
MFDQVGNLRAYLDAHPGTTMKDLRRLEGTDAAQIQKMATRLKERGELVEHPKTKALAFKDQLLRASKGVEIHEVTVGIPEDLPSIRDSNGKDRLLRKEDLVRLPDNTARALILGGKAEKIDISAAETEKLTSNVPEVGDAPIATLGASTGIEMKVAPPIPERLRDLRIRFVRVRRVGEIKPNGQPANGKEAMGNGWNEWENAYPFNSLQLAKHIADGGNYGVLCGHGLIVIDADYPEVAATVDERLPKTFTVKSGRDGAGGFHYYYWCPDLPNPIRLEVPGAKKGEGGDVQSTGKQVIGPGSTHRTGRKYEIVKDLPITEIAAEQLLAALQDFLPPPEMDTPEDMKRHVPEGGDDLDQLRIEKIVPLDKLTRHGHKYQGPCPWHGSETGSNFTIDLDKNVWHCFRHSTGGGPMHAIAIQEKIIECSESVRGGLNGEKFKEALKAAQQKYGLVLTSRVAKGKANGSMKGIVDHTAEQVDSLIRLAKQGGQAEFFHNAANMPFVRVWEGNHHEVKAICEQDFSDWIKYRAVKKTGRAPKKDPLNQAIDTVSVLARFEGEEREVYIRKGEHDGAFFYDLCDDQWRAVRITAEGWEIVDDPPVMFRRFDKMRPQVMPISGRPEALDDLVRLVNVSEESRRLLKAHIIISLVPRILLYYAFFLGPQGSTKSTGTDIFKATVDPGSDNRDSLPAKVDDLDLHLSKRCVAAYDNISRITANLSDTLTRASRGSSSRRALFTNNDENSRSYHTQIVLNAIGLESGVRPDLLDRTIIYNCEVVAEEQRLGQEEVDYEIANLMPYAFGAALDLLVKAIPIHEGLKARKGWSPRLKDAYLWMMAINKAMANDSAGGEESFEKMFKGVIERRDSDAMEGDPLAVAIEHVASLCGFIGTATELHDWINDPSRNIPKICNIETKDKNWPKGGIALGIHLPRIIAPLRSRGTYVYQCYRYELEKDFDAKGLKVLDRPKADLTRYREQERMIVISKREVKKIEPSSTGAQ